MVRVRLYTMNGRQCNVLTRIAKTKLIRKMNMTETIFGKHVYEVDFEF